MSHDLINRLLASRVVWSNDGGKVHTRPSDLEAEAATALAEAEAEIARLRGVGAEWIAARHNVDSMAKWGRLADAEAALAAALNTPRTGTPA